LCGAPYAREPEGVKIAPMARAALHVIIAVVVVTGCAQTPYFDVNSEIGHTAPATAGETIYVGVAFLRSREGDEVELLELEPVNPDLGDGRVEALVVDMREVEGDAIGIVSESNALSAGGAFAALEPIDGFAFSAAESWHPIAIVTAITTDERRRVSFDAIRLAFRVNGGPVQHQDIPSGVAICFGEPKPDSCE
jgi:hypothetical protein